MLAPGTILLESFNATVEQRWRGLPGAPIYTIVTGDLIERAAEIANETGGVYDPLFLALAEDADAVMITSGCVTQSS